MKKEKKKTINVTFSEIHLFIRLIQYDRDVQTNIRSNKRKGRLRQ